MGSTRVATYVPFEAALYFGWWYDVAFWVLSLMTYMYKGWNLPYEQRLFGLEITLMFLFAVVELPRLQLGSSGNKAEKFIHIVVMIMLSTAVLLYFTYYTSLQSFVLRIERITGGVAMALVIVQMCLALIPLTRILKLPT
eukprot:jgi/Ulvmu1/3208/UM015_0249.1